MRRFLRRHSKAFWAVLGAVGLFLLFLPDVIGILMTILFAASGVYYFCRLGLTFTKLRGRHRRLYVLALAVLVFPAVLVARRLSWPLWLEIVLGILIANFVVGAVFSVVLRPWPED